MQADVSEDFRTEYSKRRPPFQWLETSLQQPINHVDVKKCFTSLQVKSEEIMILARISLNIKITAPT